jgi:hypothetical protein
MPGPSSAAASSSLSGISRRNHSNNNNHNHNNNRHLHMAISRSIPALHVYHQKEENNEHEITQVAAVKKVRRKLKLKCKLPPVVTKRLDLLRWEQGGFYYGITPETYRKAVKPQQHNSNNININNNNNKSLSVKESMHEALQELRSMRLEMERMRGDMELLKKKMVGEEQDTEGMGAESAALARRKKQREFDKLASEVERWAEHILFQEGEKDGWTEVACNKMMRNSVNSSGRTHAYIKVGAVLYCNVLEYDEHDC